MSPPQHTRTSRKKEIPRNFILNWQCPGNQAAKPRRQMTSCEACRIAKVKCNQQQECERCIDRGIYCRYKTAPSSASITGNSDMSRPISSPDALPLAILTPSEAMSIDVNMDTTSPFDIGAGMDDREYVSLSMEDWPKETSSQSVEHFNWLPFDVSSNANVLDSLTDRGPGALDPFQTLIKTTPDYLLQTLPQLHNDSHSASFASASPPSRVSQQNTLSSANCQCRTSVTLQAPKIKSIMQERPKPQLEKVLKVTRGVIRSCQELIDCASCQADCTDLVCVMAVFQQTESCFDYLAKVNPASAIKVSVGEYEVSVNDTKWRCVLLMDLVQQANALLSSSSSLHQELFLSQRAPCRLSQINLAYVRKVIDKFSNILRSISDSINETSSHHSGSGGLSEESEIPLSNE